MAEKLPETTKPVRISQYAHDHLTAVCARNGMKIGMIVNGIIYEWMKDEIYKAPPPIRKPKQGGK